MFMWLVAEWGKKPFELHRFVQCVTHTYCICIGVNFSACIRCNSKIFLIKQIICLQKQTAWFKRPDLLLSVDGRGGVWVETGTAAHPFSSLFFQFSVHAYLKINCFHNDNSILYHSVLLKRVLFIKSNCLLLLNVTLFPYFSVSVFLSVISTSFCPSVDLSVRYFYWVTADSVTKPGFLQLNSIQI